MKLAKLLSFVLVFVMLFSLLAVSASAILCEDQNNQNQEGFIIAEKNGAVKSIRGYMAVGGEIRPEKDDEYQGVRPPNTMDGDEYTKYVEAVAALAPDAAETSESEVEG